MAVDFILHQETAIQGINPAIAGLVNLGRKQGYVTFDDIYEILQDDHPGLQQFEEVFAALLGAKIPYVEAEDVAQEPVEEVVTEEDVVEPAAEVKDRISTAAEDEQQLAYLDPDDLVSLYMNQAANHPLLSAAEEIELADRKSVV